jgi:hypothetical protein
VGRTNLAPIIITRRARRILGNDGTQLTRAPEIWEARTTDGKWTFERTEETGTPWVIIRGADGMVVTYCGSLAHCRRSVALGYAETEARVRAAGHRARAEAVAVGADCKAVEDARVRGEAAEWDLIRSEAATRAA